MKGLVEGQVRAGEQGAEEVTLGGGDRGAGPGTARAEEKIMILRRYGHMTASRRLPREARSWHWSSRHRRGSE